MRRWVTALMLCGCGFSSSATEPGQDAVVSVDANPGAEPAPAPVIDAAIDVDAASPDAPTGYCVGNLHRVCLSAAPTEDVILPAQTLDTANSSMCVAYTATPSVLACVIVGRSITIAAGTKIIVAGTKPLILLADTISIAGTLDAASHRGARNGPGADSSLCPGNFTNPSTGGGRADGGGAWGASFGGKGGAGGAGGEDGAPGVAPDAVAPTFLRGGCLGGAGAGTMGGSAGHGGGAVSLIARQTLTIGGVVNASGSSGGGSATDNGGGGGGGSGGMIVLDAPTVEVTGQCFANGGGGGEGANGISGGHDGGEATSPTAGGAAGDGGTMVGGNGGAGGAGSTALGAPGIAGIDNGGGAVGGGGGGGGGAGILKLFSASSSGTGDASKVSPPPT